MAISPQPSVRQDSADLARGAPRWRGNCRKSATEGALTPCQTSCDALSRAHGSEPKSQELTIVPHLSAQQATTWRDCAATALSVSPPAREDDIVIWRATKERARTREAFLRSTRSTLKRLASASRAAERLRRVSAERSVASPD